MTRVRSESSISQEDPLEEGMTIHSSILAWRISWTEEPGRLQSREELEATERTLMPLA